MGISVWSADVCSSDLDPRRAGGYWRNARRFPCPTSRFSAAHIRCYRSSTAPRLIFILTGNLMGDCRLSTLPGSNNLCRPQSRNGPGIITELGEDRSEEHTSELQSLMRNSHAVFCLKKNNLTPPDNNT